MTQPKKEVLGVQRFWVSIPRWHRLDMKSCISNSAHNVDLKIKFTEEDSSWFRTSLRFKVKGSKKSLQSFSEWFQEAFKEPFDDEEE